MNLTATLCQMRSPAFFTIYKQNNSKIVKKAGDRFWQSVGGKFISLYQIYLSDLLLLFIAAQKVW